METNILLEGGTNELELLEFTVGSNHYGINVAKVREILTYTPVTPVPNAHPFVEGIFMPRDEMITVIDLSKATHYTGETDTAGMLIVTNFNKLHVAFHVHKVLGIHRVSWQSVMKPDATINSNEAGITTGVVKIDGRLIIMLDFEHIVNDISPYHGPASSPHCFSALPQNCRYPLPEFSSYLHLIKTAHNFPEEYR